MRKLILAVLTVFLIGCSSESIEGENKTANATESIVQPVYNMNGLYNKIKNKHYVNIQWLTPYGFPYPTITPHYVTIKMDGVIVANNYTETYNRFSIQVSANWQQSTFEVTQTLIGVGVSAPTYITVYKYN